MVKYRGDIVFDGYDMEKYFVFQQKYPQVKYLFGFDKKHGPYIEIIGPFDAVLCCATEIHGDDDAEESIREID